MYMQMNHNLYATESQETCDRSISWEPQAKMTLNECFRRHIIVYTGSISDDVNVMKSSRNSECHSPCDYENISCIFFMH